jgi:glycosyltransferase involved in cell wall biosynthesis
VIVSDDSPNNEVEILCAKYAVKFLLRYHKNLPVKGSPANWNMSLSMAKGEWIKMMHDDDWFAGEHSLETFVSATRNNSNAGFIFSGYTTFEKGKVKKISIPGSFVNKKLKKSALNLFSKNYIGHPSNTLIKNDLNEWYDERTKWVVDFELYIRCLKKTSFYIIAEPLINIGINEEQITKTAFNDIAVVIPEHIYLLNKMGTGILKNIAVYDHYWRLFRNFKIRKIKEVEQYSGNNIIPDEIRKMLQVQFKIPLSILQVGLFSKLMMIISYFKK